MAVDFVKWQQSPAGQAFLEYEQQQLNVMLKLVSGPVVVQLGEKPDLSLLQSFEFPYSFVVSKQANEIANVVADYEFLPFDANSINTIIVPHVLERSVLPHQVLREVTRVLCPEGYAVISCFNPLSMFGLQSCIRLNTPKLRRLYSLRRLKDWLELMQFDIVGSTMFQYAPLFDSEKLRYSVRFMESVGNRWIPLLGAAYILVAKKRDYAITPLLKNKRFLKNKPALVGSVATRND